jgi:hypothetical protein
MSPAVQSIATLMVIVTIGGCSPDGGTSPASLRVVGVWNQGANLRDTVNGQTHIHTGTSRSSRSAAGSSAMASRADSVAGRTGTTRGPLPTASLMTS